MSILHPFELLVGTLNASKIREIQDLMAGLPVRLRSLKDFPGIHAVQETGNTYEENSKHKALSYSTRTRLPTLADDSGLEVDALDGKPGVLSARFGGGSVSDTERIERLLDAIDQSEKVSRTAKFVCCMTLAGWNHGQDTDAVAPVVLNVSRGELKGKILMQPRGSNGFGYDPVFVPTGHSETLAEVSSSVKNNISHRANALVGIRTFLEAWLRQT